MFVALAPSVCCPGSSAASAHAQGSGSYKYGSAKKCSSSSTSKSSAMAKICFKRPKLHEKVLSRCKAGYYGLLLVLHRGKQGSESVSVRTLRMRAGSGTGQQTLGANATNMLGMWTYLIFFGTITQFGASAQDGHYIRASWRYLDVFLCVFFYEELWCPFTTVALKCTATLRPPVTQRRDGGL